MKFNSSRALSATATMPSRERDAKNQLFIAPGTNNATPPPPLPLSLPRLPLRAQVFRGAPMISNEAALELEKNFFELVALSVFLFLSFSVSLSGYHITRIRYSSIRMFWWKKKKRGGFPSFFCHSSGRKEEGYIR